MTTLITNIGDLATCDQRRGSDRIGRITNAAMLFDERVLWIGPSHDAPDADRVFDAEGRAVIPGFVDSHAHLLFAGDRTEEFVARMQGAPYGAGGIRTTVRATREASDAALDGNLQRLREELLRHGVTHFECKTGYGLTTHDEIRAAKIAAQATDDVTLLAAHVVPDEYRHEPDAYVDLIIRDMLPTLAGVVRWVDVFCDEGAFTVAQAERLLVAAKALGYGIRMHANQLRHSAAVDLAIDLGCASADHLTFLTDAQVQRIGASSTVATLVPGAEFSTRSQYPSARRLLDAGATVAIATDCNPGSSFTTSMAMCIALAVRDMGMSPDEAVIAATSGGAAALQRDEVGVLRPGALAHIVMLDAPSTAHLAYRPGVHLIRDVWQAGQHVIDDWKPRHA